MITEILPSAYAVLGAAGFTDTVGLADRIGPVRRVLVVLVDGLGHQLLPRAAQHSPFLADVLAGRAGAASELRSTLPSTTPVSIASLTTGTQPGEHGILGFTVNVPGTDDVLVHIRWGDKPDPATWQPVPTVFERANGVPSSSVLPASFAGSGLTESAYRGSEFFGQRDRDDAVESLLRVLDARGGLVLGYVARIDTAMHRTGIASQEWADAVAWTGAMLNRLALRLPDDAALIVTADHGGLDVPQDARVDLDSDPRLTAGVRVVAGEPRLRYLHTLPGALDDVRATWTGVLGDRVDVLTRNDAIASGMFGPVRDGHRERIGDLVVVCRDDNVLVATKRESPETARLVGYHGATSAAETAIPLLTFTGRP